MKLVMVLNGGNLWRFPPDMPAQLTAVAREAGHHTQILISRSAEDALLQIGQAIEDGAEGVFAGGGDGTLHHVVNHPEIHRVALAPLPMGTINAFLRAEEVDVTNPVNALRQLLSRPVRECHCGLFHNTRFACFASLGYDARVVHDNSKKVKRYLRRYSYAVTGAVELLRPGRSNIGQVSLESGPPAPASSAIFSRIQNYAGRPCFRVTAADPWLEAVMTSDDSLVSITSLLRYIAACGPANGKPAPSRVRHLPKVLQTDWEFATPPTIQLDGEESVIDLPRSFQVSLDPRPQRFFVRA